MVLGGPAAITDLQLWSRRFRLPKGCSSRNNCLNCFLRIKLAVMHMVQFATTLVSTGLRAQSTDQAFGRGDSFEH